MADSSRSRPDEKFDYRDIVASNVSSSTAGASSGDFHVYRQQRRREIERIERLEQDAKEREETKARLQEEMARKLKEETQTQKRAAKRKRKKELRNRRKKQRGCKRDDEASADQVLLKESRNEDDAIVSKHLSDSSKRRSSLQRVAKLPLRFRRRVIWKCADAQDEGSGKEGKDNKEDITDWDSSWSEFNQNRQGGVFGLGDESTPQQRQKVDKRTERLTSAWSNDAGFLVGIGVIALIAAFYGYVYANGGIS